MSIGKQEESQGTLWLSYDQPPKSMGHAFYDQWADLPATAIVALFENTILVIVMVEADNQVFMAFSISW